MCCVTRFPTVDAIIPHSQVSSTVKSIPRDQLWCSAPVAAGALRRWLTDRGSLTARLQRHAGPIKVKVLFQGLRHANRDEAFLFASPVARVLVREVLLLRGTTPLVFAHTVLACNGLRGAWRSIARLGTRPLGAALFADPRVALLFLIPGVGETLRINGHAEISTRPDLIDSFAVDAKPPRVVLLIRVDSIYYQCARAIMRSRLWDPAARVERSSLPSSGQILAGIRAGFDQAAYDARMPQLLKDGLY